MKRQKLILTFDDGPNGEWTPQILEVLKNYNIKAVFFQVGSAVTENHKLVETVLEAGHKVGNHSWTHKPLFLRPYKQIIEEIEKTHFYFIEKFDYNISLFRPPWGAISKKIEREIQNKLNYKTIYWDVDSLDYILPVTRPLRFSRLKEKQTILFHDGSFYAPLKSRKHTVKLLDLLLKDNMDKFEFILP